jgi:hypothetical protein
MKAPSLNCNKITWLYGVPNNTPLIKQQLHGCMSRRTAVIVINHIISTSVTLPFQNIAEQYHVAGCSREQKKPIQI